MIKHAEGLRPGDTQDGKGQLWEIEAAEMQDGMIQVLWKCGEERRWDEYAPGTPIIVTPAPAVEWVRMIKNAVSLCVGDRLVGPENPPYAVTAVEPSPPRVLVEWSNGRGVRVREYDPKTGVLVETPGTVKGRVDGGV